MRTAIKFLGLVLVLALAAIAPCRAADYVDPSWENLTRALVRFNALNLTDPLLIDEYAIVTECDMYNAFYKDDFKWNEVRQAVRKSVQQNVGSFPMNFHYDIKLQLDRYDFDSKLYRFAEKSMLQNINTFVLYSVVGDSCGASTIKYIPRTFRAVLSAPLYMEGLPLAEQDGKALFKQMQDDNDTTHTIYARFNLSIVYIDPMRKTTMRSGNDLITQYQQSTAMVHDAVRMDVRLDSIEFYEDTHLARLIYRYQGGS